MSKHEEAVEFLRLSSDADSQNRSKGLEAIKFCFGDQWPQYAIDTRGNERPKLTINETDAYCRQVENQQRQQRPRVNVHATNLFADPKVAKVLKGIYRHIEVNSNADYAYDMAFSFAIRIGWGYFRLYRDYVRPDSFDQDIFYGAIENPFSCYPDPNSNTIDGSDYEKFLIATEVPIKQFESLYPGAQYKPGFTNRGTGDSSPDWVTKENIRLAEYYYLEKQKKMLVHLSNGDSFWEDELPPMPTIQAAGIQIIGDRESTRASVKWEKCTSFETLETKDIPGRYIPIVPVYGRSVMIDGKRQRFGLVKDAMDPARMNNFWHTCITESIALAPKAKWVGPEGFDEGLENEWAGANLSAKAILHYKGTGLDSSPIAAPERVAPEPPPEGAISALSLATQALQRVLGIVDPAQKIQGNVSGKALLSEQQKADNSTFNYYDNLTASIQQGAKIGLGWMPIVYDTQRVLRMIGDDGRPSLVTVNEHSQDEEGATKILNDLSVGDYDIVMDTGPGYNSKRQEALATFTELLQGPLGEEIAVKAGDLIARLYDVPGMDVLADRLAAGNPLAQIDEKSEIPPQVQMQLAQAKQTIQQLQQQLQQAGLELKYRGDIEDKRQQGETKRALMKETAHAHDVEKKAETDVTVAHLDATVAAHDTETWAAENMEQQRMQDEKDVLIQKMKGIIELAVHHMDNEADIAKEKAKPKPVAKNTA